MGLFENEREANIRSCTAMIEDALAELGHDAGAARLDGETPGPSWRFRHGSATVQVELIERKDFTHLRITAPILTVTDDTDAPALWRRLLELHAEAVHGAAFAVAGRDVQLVAERSTIDLDRSEVHDLIRRVRDYADRYDDELIAAFCARAPTGS